MRGFWIEAITFLAFLYIAWHMSQIIAFLDRIIAP
jgi:hypothetical protein